MKEEILKARVAPLANPCLGRPGSLLYRPGYHGIAANHQEKTWSLVLLPVAIIPKLHAMLVHSRLNTGSSIQRYGLVEVLATVDGDLSTASSAVISFKRYSITVCPVGSESHNMWHWTKKTHTRDVACLWRHQVRHEAGNVLGFAYVANSTKLLCLLSNW